MNEKQISTIKKHLVVKGAQVTTTSLDVANFFGKKHKDVLKAIQNLECSPEFRGRNFAPTFYEVAGPNNSSRKEPMVELTRDGFTMLGMGFTGSEAAKFRESYITAFNQMEAELIRSQSATNLQAMAGQIVVMVVREVLDKVVPMVQTISDRQDRVEKGIAQRAIERQLNPVKTTVAYDTTYLRVFVTCNCEKDEASLVRKTELYNRYRSWCAECRYAFYGYGSFCKALQQAFPHLSSGKVRVPGSRYQSPVFYGLGLKAVEEAGEEAQS